MADYKIELKRSAAKEIDKIKNKKDRQRIVERIAGLADAPWLSEAGRAGFGRGSYRTFCTHQESVIAAR